MRRFEKRETTFHLDDEDAPEVWMNWSGQKRRVRFQAQCVVIDWHREGLGEWLLWRVWVTGPRIHAQTQALISETFFDDAGERRSMPSWLSGFVELTHPNQPQLVTR